jgi:putative transposase
VQLLKRYHQTVQRQRRDFHHKTALALLQQYDVISLEDLQVRNLVRNHHLAKRISDAGWAAFRAILEAKAACAGRPVRAVPARALHQPGLQRGAVRWEPLYAAGRQEPVGAHPCLHVCPFCGLVLDRDENATLNMRRAGQARQAPTWPAGASVT